MIRRTLVKARLDGVVAITEWGLESRGVAISQREKQSTAQRALESGQALLGRRALRNRHMAAITRRDDTGKGGGDCKGLEMFLAMLRGIRNNGSGFMKDRRTIALPDKACTRQACGRRGIFCSVATGMACLGDSFLLHRAGGATDAVRGKSLNKHSEQHGGGK